MSDVDAVLTVVPHEDGQQAESWFRAVRSAYEEAGEDWSGYVTRLTSVADRREAVELFVHELESGSEPLEVVRRLCEHGDDLPRMYADATARPEAETADTTGEYDEDAWFAYLAQNGPMWDGTEENWAAFRDWFVYHAEEAGLAEPVEAFIGYVESQPDKVAVFAAYDVTLAEEPAGEEPAPAAADGASAPDLVATVGLPALELVIAQNPEFAELDPDELATILGEVLAEELTGS